MNAPTEADPDLVELRRLHEAATEAPWAWEMTGDKDNSWGVGIVVDEDYQPVVGRNEPGENLVVESICDGSDTPENAELIAVMRNALPSLLDRAEEARGVRAVLHEAQNEIVRLRALVGGRSAAPTREQIHDAIADALSEHVWASGTGEIDGDGINEAADARGGSALAAGGRTTRGCVMAATGRPWRGEPPVDVPEGVRAVVRAFPVRPAGGRPYCYDVWLVDRRRWTGRLDQDDALAALVAEGYKRNRANGLLRQARDAGDNRLPAGRARRQAHRRLSGRG